MTGEKATLFDRVDRVRPCSTEVDSCAQSVSSTVINKKSVSLEPHAVEPEYEIGVVSSFAMAQFKL